MKKITIFSVIVAVLMVSVSFALAKDLITGYDVNNNFAPVQVEKGVYTPGISLYPFETKTKVCPACDNIGSMTKDDLIVKGETQLQRLVQGGTVLNASSTLTTALTLTAAQVCNSSVIKVNTAATINTVAAASLDITMPATSTLFADCLNDNGDSIRFLFVNASPTAASTTEMIAGTGCNAMISGDTGAADTIAGGSSAYITIQRMTDYLGSNGTADCEVIIEELISH
jgi:hypothetical protein